MAEILYHLGCMKPYKYWDKLPINWCRISAINSMLNFVGASIQFIETTNAQQRQSHPRIYLPTQDLPCDEGLSLSFGFLFIFLYGPCHPANGFNM